MNTRNHKYERRIPAGRPRPLTWLLVAGSVLSTQLAGATQTIQVRPNVDANGPQVLLRDVATNPSDLPEGWDTRVVLASPAIGKPQSLALPAIAYALQRYDDMRDINLRGSPRVNIQRAARTLDPSELATVVSTHIHGSDPWQGQNVELEFGPIPSKILVPMGACQMTVSGIEETRASGVDASVVIRVDGDYVQTVTVPLTIRQLFPVWVATRPLEQGHIVLDDDLQSRLLPIDWCGRHLVPTNQPVVGMELDRAVSGSQPIPQPFLRQPLCAERGDYISVTATLGVCQVTLRAKALARGRRGDRILCVNESSKRQIMVSLVGARQAALITF